MRIIDDAHKLMTGSITKVQWYRTPTNLRRENNEVYNDKTVYANLRSQLAEILEFWGPNVQDADVNEFFHGYLNPVLDEEKPFKLYRYMPPRYFNIRNIETQMIHLSTNGSMNDTFEGIPEFRGKLSCQDAKELEDLAYMACFTEENDNTLMWSHYAKDHTGVCVEYDLKKLDNDTNGVLSHLFPIVYSEQRPALRDIGSMIDSQKQLNEAINKGNVYDGKEPFNDILPLFLTKGKVWEYEKEWRILYTKKQMYDIDDEELYTGNLSFKCISSIYLGYRIQPAIKQHLLEISKRLSSLGSFVPVYQAQLSPGGYNIVFERC